MQDAIGFPRHAGTSRRARRLTRRARAFAPILAVPAIFALLALTMNRIEYGPALPRGAQPDAGTIGVDAATPRTTRTAATPTQTRTDTPEAPPTLDPEAAVLSSASVIAGGWGTGATGGAELLSSFDPNVPSAERSALR